MVGPEGSRREGRECSIWGCILKAVPVGLADRLDKECVYVSTHVYTCVCVPVKERRKGKQSQGWLQWF